MRRTKRFIICFLTMLAALMAVTACAGVNQSPESVARAYVSATSKLDFNKIIQCSDYKGEYKNADAKNAAKALFDLSVSMVPAEAKAQLKTYQFKKYEKISAEEVEEIEETGGNSITITAKETAKVTITYKKDGKGKAIEETMNMTFVKVDGKWYTKAGSLVTLD